MEWRKSITDLVDKEVVECLKKVFSDIKEVTKIERDKELEHIEVHVLTNYKDKQGNTKEYKDILLLKIDDIISDIFYVYDEDVVRYRQWLLVHGIHPLIINNPFI